MTLVEVMIAMTILSGALLALATFTGRMTRATADANLRTTAEQLATERLEAARWSGTYTALDTFARTETSIAGFTGYRRQTWVARTGGATGDSLDFKTVTISVTNPVMATPVRKTTIIAVF
jgi:Tfp pilus assembly protein PilV